jgi:predicted GNAT family N-acyltransferase
MTTYRGVVADDVDSIHAIEAASYPDDEAASLTNLQFRAEAAAPYFRLAIVDDKIAGYICGTLTNDDVLTHASMETHDDGGRNLCIHSVCVPAPLRRRGIALAMLHNYINTIKTTQPQIKKTMLIAKQDVGPLYEAAGFSKLGLSEVVVGSASALSGRRFVERAHANL